MSSSAVKPMQPVAAGLAEGGTTVTPRQRPKASAINSAMNPIISLPGNNGLAAARRALNPGAGTDPVAAAAPAPAATQSAPSPATVNPVTVQQLFPTFPQVGILFLSLSFVA